MPELTSAFVALSADVVAAYVSNNSVTQADLPALIASVHGALRDAANGKQQAEKVVLEPPVSIKKSISASHLISMEDGRPYKSLKRHLTARGLTPAQYREKWSLPFDYPMVAPNYSKARSELAKALGWVRSRRAEEREEARGLSQGDCAADCPAGRLGRVRRHQSRRHSSSFSSIHSGCKNLGEHRFDLPSATEPHLKFEQARVLGLEAAERLGGGGDLLGLRSEPPLIARATDCKRTVQLWHGPPPFVGRSPFCQTAEAADVRPDTCKRPSWAGPFAPWLAGLVRRL